jgi:cytochrome c oxidase cbb3-type subunit 3
MRVAFPFARGEIALDTPVEQLTPAQQREGGACSWAAACPATTARASNDEGPAWSARPVSYPRMGFVPGQPNTPPVDAVSSASVYAKHEVVPRWKG